MLRQQRWAKKIFTLLRLRADISVAILNRVILALSAEERAVLRALGAMQQEWYLATKDTVSTLEKRCYNAHHTLELRATRAMPISLIDSVREMLAFDDQGDRIILRTPPSHFGKNNPITRKCNKALGITHTRKGVMAPYVFKDRNQIVATANQLLEGRTLHLAQEFDGAAWDVRESCADVLAQASRDNNLLDLPLGWLRNIQIIFDQHGWTAKTGAVRFVTRCTQLVTNHNDPRNSRDPIFYLGEDKTQHLLRAIAIGGDCSFQQRMRDGLFVKETPASEMPPHVQADPDFCALARIECALFRSHSVTVYVTVHMLYRQYYF